MNRSQRIEKHDAAPEDKHQGDAAAILRAHALDAIQDAGERNRFESDMGAFNERWSRVNPSRAAELYREVDRLFTAPAAGSRVGRDWRIRAAEQTLHHAAFPTQIDQGFHNSCGAAALEGQMFARDPGDAARVVADAAINGNVRKLGAKAPVKLDVTLTTPDYEAAQLPTPDGSRDFSSQLFQTAAINAVNPGFRQIANSGTTDTGERVPDASKSKRGAEKQYCGAYCNDVFAMNDAIAGKRNTLVVIEHSSRDSGSRATHVGSREGFMTTMASLKRRNAFPVILDVNSNNEPFWTDHHRGQPGGSGSWHFTGLADFDPAGASGFLDNQWGSAFDHPRVPAGQLYMSLQGVSTDSLKELQSTVLNNRNSGVQDNLLELQLIRREKDAGSLKASEIEAQVNAVMTVAKWRWTADQMNGRLDQDEQRRTLSEYEAMKANNR